MESPDQMTTAHRVCDMTDMSIQEEETSIVSGWSDLLSGIETRSRHDDDASATSGLSGLTHTMDATWEKATRKTNTLSLGNIVDSIGTIDFSFYSAICQSYSASFSKPKILDEPRFTAQEEASEMNRLTEVENETILDDVFGRKSYIPYTNSRTKQPPNAHNDISQKLIEEFHCALEKILANTTVALGLVYVEALMKCPDVVETESDPVRFLRYEDYDPELAALRLLKYWEMRKVIFDQKAFLPLTLEGAMSDNAEWLVKFPSVFQELPNDRKGRSVICIDKTDKLLGHNAISAVDHVRCFWYILHLVLRKELAQINGFVIIIIDYSYNMYSGERNRLMSASARYCLPMKIRAAHLVVDPLYRILTLPVFKFFVGPTIRSRTNLHSGSTEERLESLEGFDLDRTGLPPSLGGTFIVSCKLPPPGK